MGYAVRFLPHSVQLNTNAGVAGWINQIESTQPESGITLFEESSGSEIDREFVSIRGVEPTLPIVTSDLAILTTIGIAGLPIASGSAKPGLLCYGRELPLEAVPTAIGTAHHLLLSVSDGLLIPVSVRASHSSVAKLSLLLHAILGTDGTSGARPFVYTANSAINAGAGQLANIYTTGPFKYTISGGASRFVAGIRDINVNFGIKILKESTDGNVYPSHVSIIARMPTIEFSTVDTNLIAEIGDGVSVSAAAGYFQKCTASGQRVAAATTSHIAITGTAGVITPGALNLTHQTPGSVAFTYTPALNSTIITISIASAMPTS